MANPTYASVSVLNYNASAPADDGSQVASNLIKWAHVKEKIGDPLKTAIESINTNVDAAIDAVKLLFAVVTTKSSAYPTVAGDDGTLFAVSGNTTITLLAAATAGAGHRIGVYKSDGAGTIVTIDGNASETINGSATITLINQYEAAVLVCDGSNWIIAEHTMVASLDLNQGTGDGIIQTWRSTDVAHGVTDIAATSVYGYVKKNDAGAGVLEIGGLAETGNGAALMLVGYAASSSTSASTGARSAVETAAYSFSGASVANMAADAMVFGVRCQRGGGQVTVAIWDEDGNGFTDDTVSTYDDYDDASLLYETQMLTVRRDDVMPPTEYFERLKRLSKLKLTGYVSPEQWAKGERPLWGYTTTVKLLRDEAVQRMNRESVLWETLEKFLPGAMAYASEQAKGRNVGRMPVRQ